MLDFKNSPVNIPSINLDGKTVIITGGSRGLGEAMAYVLAAYEAEVVISSRSLKDCEKVSDNINKMGGKAIAVQCDVRIRQEVERLIQKTEETYGKVDVMINNAGIGVTTKLINMTEDGWNKVMDTNVKGVFNGIVVAGKSMLDHEIKGRIINIASAGGLVGTKNIAAYCASKAAVISLSKSAAMEFGRQGITVNSICPGYIPTYINKDSLENPRVKEKIIDKTAFKRLGESWEIASIALFLASDASSIITGAYIAADMGTTCN